MTGFNTKSDDRIATSMDNAFMGTKNIPRNSVAITDTVSTPFGRTINNAIQVNDSTWLSTTEKQNLSGSEMRGGISSYDQIKSYVRPRNLSTISRSTSGADSVSVNISGRR